VGADDPELTVRDFQPPEGVQLADVQPRRVVLGNAPATARAQPALSLSGHPEEILRSLAREGVLQLLLEGGPTTARAFVQAGLVDRLVLYLAPALAGGSEGRGILEGPGPSQISELLRGRIEDVRRFGADVRITFSPSQ